MTQRIIYIVKAVDLIDGEIERHEFSTKETAMTKASELQASWTEDMKCAIVETIPGDHPYEKYHTDGDITIYLIPKISKAPRESPCGKTCKPDPEECPGCVWSLPVETRNQIERDYRS